MGLMDKYNKGGVVFDIDIKNFKFKTLEELYKAGDTVEVVVQEPNSDNYGYTEKTYSVVLSTSTGDAGNTSGSQKRNRCYRGQLLERPLRPRDSGFHRGVLRMPRSVYGYGNGRDLRCRSRKASGYAGSSHYPQNQCEHG